MANLKQEEPRRNKDIWSEVKVANFLFMLPTPMKKRSQLRLPTFLKLATFLFMLLHILRINSIIETCDFDR